MTATESSPSTRCLICSAQATGFHFEAQSCSACAAFFRRTVALTKSFICITGRDDCQVHYSMHQICRSCRHRKCLASGMKPTGVQPKKPNVETGRAFFTKSGLKRNKKFANVSPQTADEQKLVVEVTTKIPKIEVQDFNPQSVCSLTSDESEFDIKSPTPLYKYSTIRSTLGSSFNSPPMSVISSPKSPLGSLPENPSKSISESPPGPNLLNIFIQEEMKLGERRRLLFSEGAVGTLLGQNQQCPYKKEDIKPLVFHDFRLTIKTHIMLIYEWLQAWPKLQDLDDFDRMSILRKAVLIHFLLDPSFLSYQVGEPDKLIMQNGGFISTTDYHGVGWQDEPDISGENKRKYYVPIMKMITDEIMPAMHALKITFEEFAALKTLASLQGSFENISEEKREILRDQVKLVLASLHAYYVANSIEDVAERYGSICLMLSCIFTAGNDFVQNHREIDIFHIWDLDKLVLQLLNLDKIMEAEVRETAEMRAIRNGINVNLADIRKNGQI